VGDGSDGTGTAGQQGRGVAALTRSRSADAVIGAGVSGFHTMTYGAEAGTNFGGDGPFRQQIKKAKVAYGTVMFIKLGGPAMRIYNNGMLVAEMAAGASQLEANIEVGRQPLEFRSAVNHAVLWQGDLMLDRSHVIQLAFDDRTAPKPQVRSWLWQGY